MRPIQKTVPGTVILTLMLLCSAVDANEPRATGNPCAAFIEDQRHYGPRTPAERQITGRKYLYNGVDDLAAALDRPLPLGPEFTGPHRAACVIFDVRFANQGGQVRVVEATPKLVYPSVHSSLVPGRHQAGEAVLRQIPFDRLVRQMPNTTTTQLVAVPLWPGHPLYTNDRGRIAGTVGNDLQSLGYGPAELIARQGTIAVYHVFELEQRNTLYEKFVVLREMNDTDVLDVAAAAVFRELIAPWMERRARNHPMSIRQMQAEVRHYARGLRIPFDERLAEAGLPFVVEPRTEKPVEHPVLVAFHGAGVVRQGVPIQWSQNFSNSRYTNLAALRTQLAEARITPEERARRAAAAQAEQRAAEQRAAADQDSRQQARRAQIDPSSPLAALGYPAATLLFKEGRTTYYLADMASPDGTVRIRPVVAVHDLGEHDPVLDFVDAGDGDVRYSDARIAFVRTRLLPAALARWPDLRWLEVHHHVRGFRLPDTAEFRRAGPRGYGFTFDQPVFQEQYAPDKAGGRWQPQYELDTSRPRLVDLSLREYGRTVAEARALRRDLDDGKRLADLTPAQRRAEITARRMAAAARRPAGFVYKSDRFWASMPRSYIAQQTFNGDFDKFQVRVSFPRNYIEFVYAYSRHCEAEIKAAGNFRTDVLTTQQVTLDGYGNVLYAGQPRTTYTYIPEALVDKFDEYSVVVNLANTGEAMALMLNPDDMAAMGARMLTTSPMKFLDSLIHARPGSQGASGEMFSTLLGLTYSWNHFFGATPRACSSATVYQMRENLVRAAYGRPSLQKAGLRVPNAAAESEPLVPAAGARTVFDGCFENHEYQKADFCICMDLRGEQVMTPQEKRRYAGDFQTFYDEIVFPTKRQASDPRWRLYELFKRCAD